MLDGGVCFCLQHVLPASFGPLCGSVSTKLSSMALGSCLFIAGSETFHVLAWFDLQQSELCLQISALMNSGSGVPNKVAKCV